MGVHKLRGMATPCYRSNHQEFVERGILQSGGEGGNTSSPKYKHCE